MIRSVPPRTREIVSAWPAPPAAPAGLQGRPFEERAVEVSAKLRSAVAAVISALPEQVSGGTDLDRQLKLGSTVSWRLYSFANEANPLTALEYLPGRATIGRLAQAVQKKGLPGELAERLREAFDKFEAFTAEYAGDRATLASLVSGVRNDGPGQIARRRSTFRLNADHWGIRAKTHLSCLIVQPGIEPRSQEEWVLVRGDVQAESLRRGAVFSVTHRAGAEDTPGHTVPSDSLEVLTQFCSRPLPEITSVVDPYTGYRETRILAAGIGKSSSLNFFTRERILLSNKESDPVPDMAWDQAAMVRVPVSLQIGDLLVPRGRADPASVAVAVYGNLANVEKAFQFQAQDRLPISEEAVYLGAELSALQTPDVPNYPEMIEHVLNEQGWGKEEFDIFRCRVQYPVLHTIIKLSVSRRMGYQHADGI